jgi:hypothetical protein
VILAPCSGPSRRGLTAWKREARPAREPSRSTSSNSSDVSIARGAPDLRIGSFAAGRRLPPRLRARGELSLVVELPDLADAPRIMSHGNQLTIYLTDARRYGITLPLATGSSSHIDELRFLARSKGLVLDEKGLRRGSTIIASQNEEEIYWNLKLPFIPPELREGSGEIARAQAGALPKLVTYPDIRGVLHAHTDLSDGVDTLEAMAEATRARGYEYFGVADHSRSAHYAGGLSIDEIAAQHAEIDRLNRKQSGGFRILKGIESDILADGSLDLSRRGARKLRLCCSERPQPLSARPRGTNRANCSRRKESPHNHPRAYDRTAASTAARIRCGHPAGARGLRSVWRSR